MKGNSRYKAAAVFIVIVLLLGGLGLLSAGRSAAQSRKIQGVVTEQGNPTNLLVGVEVTLYDAHGQKAPVVAFTTGAGTYSFTPGPGFYYITVLKSGFFNNQTTVFRFDDTVNLVKDIEMEKMPFPGVPMTLSVHVEDSGGAAVPNATVELFNVTKMQVLSSKLSNSTGNTSFSVWAGSFEVRVEKETFEKSVTALEITGSQSITVTLATGIKLVGIAKEPDGTFIDEGLVAYLYNTDGGTPQAKRLLTATITGSSYTFYAYAGNFVLIVDANRKAASVTSLSVSSPVRIDRVLSGSPEERVDITLRYLQGGWNGLNIWRNLTLNEDSTIPGLAFDFVRNLRLQVDLALGNGDGTLSVSERGLFLNWLQEAGPKHVDTNGFFTTNSKYYRSDVVSGSTDFSVWFEDFPLDQGAVRIASIANYTLIGQTIPPDMDKYFANITARHDTNTTVRVNNTYTLSVVPGYERVVTSKSGSVDVKGYITIAIDPQVAAGSFDVKMELERSLQGTARVQAIGPAGRFTELNASVENYVAVVPTGVNLTFSAEESTDPNSPDGRVSPDANFTWKFTNATVPTEVTAYGIRPNVLFATMGNYTGNLTLVETGGNVTYRDFTLHVDGIQPSAVVENNVTGLGTNANGTAININEGRPVKFFGGSSTDQVHENMTGTVREWKWDLDGDGKVDATGETVDWTFSKPGNFTVNLTAVDQAGHESVNATMWVVVADVTPPTVEFRILDTEFREALSVMEGKTYYFEASNTADNFDKQEEMTFQWDFGDGKQATGLNVTFVYEKYGNYDLKLNVTDRAGNVGNATRKLVVEVDAQTRPDLEIETNSLKMDPPNPEETTLFGSVVVTLQLNVTNKEGRAAAFDVQVSFWAFRFGGSPGDPLGIQPRFYDENGNEVNNTLMPGQKKTVRFTWVTPAQGNYTLRVNVTDAREPDLFVGPRNTAEIQTDVREAAWKTPLIIAAIVGVIAGIPAAIYLRRRLKAPGRERITKRK